MIFGELPLADAQGAVLAHSITIAGQRLAKGSMVDQAILQAARDAGLVALMVARAEPGDVAEADAATAIAHRLAGAHIKVHAPVHGRVNLHARVAGLLLLDPQSITAANLASEAVAISTLAPLSPVAAGAMLATVKIIPFAVPGTLLAELSPQPLEIVPFRPGLSALLVKTRLPDTAPKLLAKTTAVTAARLAALGIEMVEVAAVEHDVAALAAVLRQATASLILIAGAAATTDRRDVVPAAITLAGGTVERVGMPVDPGNLLVLGALGNALAIGLPGCAKSPKRNGLDLVLERFAAGLPVGSETLAGMGVGGLLDEAGRPVPWAYSAR